MIITRKMLEIFENTANGGRFDDVFNFFWVVWIIFITIRGLIRHGLRSGWFEPYSQDQINSAPFYDRDWYQKRNEKIENATRMRNEKDYSKLVQRYLAGVSFSGRRLEITFFINEVVFYSKN